MTFFCLLRDVALVYEIFSRRYRLILFTMLRPILQSLEFFFFLLSFRCLRFADCVCIGLLLFYFSSQRLLGQHIPRFQRVYRYTLVAMGYMQTSEFLSNETSYAMHKKKIPVLDPVWLVFINCATLQCKYCSHHKMYSIANKRFLTKLYFSIKTRIFSYSNYNTV